jgi:hypothetical protein
MRESVRIDPTYRADPRGSVAGVEPALHPDVQPLARLLGSWRGEGEGFYPTIDPFRYREEIVFEHVGDPFLLYRQASWQRDDDVPLHFERSFLRPGSLAGSWELMLAHPLGLTEIAQGLFEATPSSWPASASNVRRRDRP